MFFSLLPSLEDGPSLWGRISCRWPLPLRNFLITTFSIIFESFSVTLRAIKVERKGFIWRTFNDFLQVYSSGKEKEYKRNGPCVRERVRQAKNGAWNTRATRATRSFAYPGHFPTFSSRGFQRIRLLHTQTTFFSAVHLFWENSEESDIGGLIGLF